LYLLVTTLSIEAMSLVCFLTCIVKAVPLKSCVVL
jgi:hypothetical protein